MLPLLLTLCMFKEGLDKIMVGSGKVHRGLLNKQRQMQLLLGEVVFKTVRCVASAWSLEESSVKVLKAWK